MSQNLFICTVFMKGVLGEMILCFIMWKTKCIHFKSVHFMFRLIITHSVENFDHLPESTTVMCLLTAVCACD